MTQRNQCDRWESIILAACLAVAGTLFLFDKLGILMNTGLFSFNTVLHSAPLLVATVGIGLMLADHSAPPKSALREHKDGRYER